MRYWVPGPLTESQVTRDGFYDPCDLNRTCGWTLPLREAVRLSAGTTLPGQLFHISGSPQCS